MSDDDLERQERAAIMEYDGGLSREEAEWSAGLLWPSEWSPVLVWMPDGDGGWMAYSEIVSQLGNPLTWRVTASRGGKYAVDASDSMLMPPLGLFETVTKAKECCKQREQYLRRSG